MTTRVLVRCRLLNLIKHPPSACVRAHVHVAPVSPTAYEPVDEIDIPIRVPPPPAVSACLTQIARRRSIMLYLGRWSLPV